MIVDVDDMTNRYEFTYLYDNLFNAILLRMENESKDTVIEIDSLTKDSFVFHSTTVISFGGLTTTGVSTYKGKRIK